MILDLNMPSPHSLMLMQPKVGTDIDWELFQSEGYAIPGVGGVPKEATAKRGRAVWKIRSKRPKQSWDLYAA